MRAALLFGLAVAVLGLAAPASAATKNVKVKVNLNSIAGDDLEGTIDSGESKCLKNRTVKLTGDSTDVATTDANGYFRFEEGNLYQPGSWTVTIKRSKRFGPANKPKRCVADRANYDYTSEEATITFSITLSEGSGTISDTHEDCISGYPLSLYRDADYVAETYSDSDGDYEFDFGNFVESGTYKVVMSPATVYLSPRNNGNLEAGDCFGQSEEVTLTW